MSHLKKHLFICENKRPDGHPRGCCADKGGKEIKNALKVELAKRGIKKEFRANTAGCLDVCEHGVSMVIYPQNIWYGNVKTEDISQIIEDSILNDLVIKRLEIKSKNRDLK